MNMLSLCVQTERLLAAMIANGAMANGANPALIAAGLNPPIVVGGAGGVGGGAGLNGQLQIAQVSPLGCQSAKRKILQCYFISAF